MRGRVLMIGAFLLATGCGLPTMVKPGGSEAEFKRDDYECQRETYRPAGIYYGSIVHSVDRSMYRKCMEARGYRVE